MRWVSLLLLVVLSGCDSGPELGEVSGTVTYQGKPVSFGTVALQPSAGGPPASGKIQPDGTFTLSTREHGSGAPVGHNLVRVTSFESQSPDADPDMVGLGKSLIPEHYADYGTSGLSVEVVAGNNPPLDLQLKD